MNKPISQQDYLAHLEATQPLFALRKRMRRLQLSILAEGEGEAVPQPVRGFDPRTGQYIQTVPVQRFG